MFSLEKALVEADRKAKAADVVSETNTHVVPKLPKCLKGTVCLDPVMTLYLLFTKDPSGPYLLTLLFLKRSLNSNITIFNELWLRTNTWLKKTSHPKGSLLG